MLKKKLAIAIGLSGAIASGAANAQSFSVTELLQVGSSLPQIGDIADGANLDTTSGTITLNDGSTLVVKTTDSNTTLAEALSSNNTTLLVDGKEVRLGTSAGSLEDAYNNSGQTANFTVSAVADSRPITLEWDGPLNAVETESTFNAKLNGTPVTLELPEGTSLADFDGDTQLRILDADGNVILSGSLNSVSADQINALASELGALNADKSLRAAQKQSMAQTFGMLSQQIDVAMAPGNARLDGISSGDASRFTFAEGMNAWVSTEVGDVSGNSAGLEYEGDSKAAMFGVDKRMDNVLAGVAAGYSKFELTSRYGNSDLSGNMIVPYGAIGLLDDNLVLSGILLYQDLDGEYTYANATTDWDGDRMGARAASTYYLPRFGNNENMLAGLTLGAAYLNDDLEDDIGNDIGAELGEAFAGASLSAELGAGRIYGSVTYYEDITSDFDSGIDVLEEDDENRTEVKIGATHKLGTDMNFNIAARTTVGSSDTEYDAVQASIEYQF